MERRFTRVGCSRVSSARRQRARRDNTVTRSTGGDCSYSSFPVPLSLLVVACTDVCVATSATKRGLRRCH